MKHLDERAAGTRASRAWRGALWLLAIGLSACGGGGGGGSEPAAQAGDGTAGRYFPASVGDRWLYVDSDASVPVTVKVVGSETVDGHVGGIVHASDDPNDIIVVEDAQGVRQVPTAGADQVTAAIGPLQVLRYPLKLGDTFTNVDKSLGALFDFDGDGVNDLASIRGTVKVVEYATVVTSAGTFTDCLHTLTTQSLTIQLSGQRRAVTVVQAVDDWLAPDIGLVRSRLVLSGDGMSFSSSREISAYGVGRLRSDNVAPTATAPALTASTALGPSTQVDIRFDEDMDEQSLSSALAVVDGTGHAVAGTVSTEPRAIHFTPTVPWLTGGYTARLAATATDIVGNPAAASQWAFTVDATAPIVVATSPLQGTIDVALASSIVLDFSEPVLPSSVNDGSVRVDYDGAQLLQVDYAVQGTRVTLTPRTGLVRGKSYRVFVDSVTDLAGNAVVPTALSFTTDPGRFGAPVSLAIPAPGLAVGGAVALGDVNGDGRVDVVATAWPVERSAGVPLAQVAVYLQQSDGSLAPPELLTLRADVSGVTGLQIADVDGDGRNDLVIAEGDQGVEIFRQTPQGRLSFDGVVPTGTSSILRLADMNADGRPDIVSFGANAVSVWLNLPGGWAVSDSITVTTYQAARGLAIGDLNGDGRLDVAFASEMLPGIAAAGVLMQGTDGRLTGPQWIYDDYHSEAFELTVGDLNGDGRDDILLEQAIGLRLVAQRADGTLAPPVAFDDTFFPGSPVLADLNGDGRADVVAVDGAGTMRVWLRQGDGGWAAPASYPGPFLGVARDASSLAVGDINGDGRVDLVSGNDLFMQRSVPVTSQSIAPGRVQAHRASMLSSLRAALRAAVMTR